MVETQENKNEILTALRSGACTFTYTKVDGELRVATGTLDPTLIPEEARPKSDKPKSQPAGVIRYYDLGAKAWRSFVAENLQTLSLSI